MKKKYLKIDTKSKKNENISRVHFIERNVYNIYVKQNTILNWLGMRIGLRGLPISRSMTEFMESNMLDMRMLRSFRVLRPLKLVSRIPSKALEMSRDHRKAFLTQ